MANIDGSEKLQAPAAAVGMPQPPPPRALRLNTRYARQENQRRRPIGQPGRRTKVRVGVEPEKRPQFLAHVERTRGVAVLHPDHVHGKPKVLEKVQLLQKAPGMSSTPVPLPDHSLGQTASQTPDKPLGTCLEGSGSCPGAWNRRDALMRAPGARHPARTP